MKTQKVEHPPDSALDHTDYGFRALCEKSDSLVLLMSPEGEVSFANALACEILMISMNKIVGKSIEEFFSTTDSTPIISKIKSMKPVPAQLKPHQELPIPIDIEFFEVGRKKNGTVIACVVDNSLIYKGSRNTVHIDKPDYQKLSEAVRREVENERSIFARDIHDEICGNLSGILVQLSNLKKKLEAKGDQEAIGDLDKIAAHTLETLDSSRRISHRIRPSLLDKLGIEAAIEQLLQEFSENFSIQAEMISKTDCIDGEVAGKVLSDQQKIEIYRISHEVLNNVIKHAHATRVICQISCDERFVTFTFADNGVGIQLESRSGNGILGMRERAHSAKGTLQISAGKPKGTLVKLRVGFSNEAVGGTTQEAS